MKNQRLIERIDARLKVLGLSDRKASMNAGLGVDAIRVIRNGHAPSAERLAKLARALGVPGDYLASAADTGDLLGGGIRLDPVFVRGAVQAGAWRDAIEWDGEDWYSLTVPADPRYPGIERFGLVVRGPSMDRLYPDGTVVICVRFGDLGRDPRSGEKVICLRRAKGDGFEATIKEYAIDENGRHVLWPRSSAPEFQQPFILAPGNLHIGGYEDLPPVVHAGDLPHDGGEPDIIITALVVGAYRPEA